MAVAYRTFVALLAALLLAGAVSALTISTTTDNSTVSINITAGEQQERISYAISPGGNDGSCENCSALVGQVTLSPGEYLLAASSVLGNSTQAANVTFVIEELMNTNATNTSVNATNVSANTTNNVTINATTNVSANVTTNVTANTTNVSTNVTTNVSANVTTNTTSNVTTNATTNTTTNVTTNVTNSTTPSNETGTPRFTQGLNKLPQAVEAGELSDAQLAALIRNSSLNPGVLNRLIKTGRLGNESVSAIIETQKTPPSIFMKIGRAIGLDLKTPKERLAESYNLTAEQEEKLSQDPDVSEKVSKKLKASAEEKKTPLGQAKKQAAVEGSESDEQEQVPPGQAKKQAADETSAKGQDAKPVKESGKPAKEQNAEAKEKSAPGQAKKQN